MLASACIAVPTPGMLDDGEMTVRIGTELLGVVVERGPHAAHHAVQMRGVLRVVEDPDRDVAPTRRFMHRVARGEEGPLVADRRIGGIVEVAAAAFRPRAAQRSRRDGDLVLVRCPPPRRTRCPRRAIAGSRAFDVVERRDQRARREPVLPPVAALMSSRLSLIADGGKPRRFVK